MATLRPTGCREVVESKDEAGRFLVVHKVEYQSYESQQFPETGNTVRWKTQVARRQSDSNSQVEVDIRTEETYMTYETYIYAGREDEG